MRKPYLNKTFGKIQNFLDELKANPENRYEIYKNIKETITKEEIDKHELKEVIDKIVIELKDFYYDDITNYIQ
jgi:hypothetical protein